MNELEKAELVYPEEPKCVLFLLLDTSGSMDEYVEGKKKIDELNEGVKTLQKELIEDELAKKRVEIAMITFGGDSPKESREFKTPEEFNPPKLEASGLTPMGNAILEAINLVEVRKQFYKDKGIDYYRPWIWLITDGYPTDMDVGDSMWNEVVKAVHEGEENKKFLFWAVGVEGADMNKLKMISPSKRVPLKLKGAKFKEMFEWLSKSMKSVSGCRVGDQIKLEAPGWGEVET